MAVEVKELLPITQRHEELGLSDETVLQMYYHLLLSRRLDERCWVLQRQGRVPFHISGIAHEGIGVGAAYALRKGFDIVHPYYRDLALSIAMGMKPVEFMLALYGKGSDARAVRRSSACGCPPEMGYSPHHPDRSSVAKTGARASSGAG